MVGIGCSYGDWWAGSYGHPIRPMTYEEAMNNGYQTWQDWEIPNEDKKGTSRVPFSNAGHSITDQAVPQQLYCCCGKASWYQHLVDQMDPDILMLNMMGPDGDVYWPGDGTYNPLGNFPPLDNPNYFIDFSDFGG